MYPDELSAVAAPPRALAGMGAGLPIGSRLLARADASGVAGGAEGFQYCAVVEHSQLQAMAAVWRYSEDAWEVASVYTRPEARGRGYAQAVVSFVTAAILSAGKRATCSAASDNPAMQRVAECVGFQRVT